MVLSHFEMRHVLYFRIRRPTREICFVNCQHVVNQKSWTIFEMVLSHYEMRHALYFRGQSISELRLRDAITRSRRARDFLTQVTCHREMQVALRRLVAGYQTGRSNEYKFNCTVIQNSWRFEGVSILKLFHTNSTFLLLLSWFQFEVIESLVGARKERPTRQTFCKSFKKLWHFWKTWF
jgi:hypothetical protein